MLNPGSTTWPQAFPAFLVAVTLLFVPGTVAGLLARLRPLTALGVAPGELKIAFELPSNEAGRAAVEAGAGVTAISEQVAAGSLRVGRLVEARLRLPARPFSALSHSQRRRSAAAAALLQRALN